MKNLQHTAPAADDMKDSLHRRFFSHVPDRLWNDWRWQMRSRTRSVGELAKYLTLTQAEQQQLGFVTARYPLSITPHYLCLINPDDPLDPIRRQAVPSAEETALADFGDEDPLAEHELSPVPGLVHRYPDRALIITNNICPVMCRHCNRKRQWRQGPWIQTDAALAPMLEYIKKNPQIRDVILSGGDPLSFSTARLERLISALRSIAHVDIIRIGTRYPVTLPQRITPELCAMLSRYGPIWVNTHFNHPRELTPEAARACDSLVRAGMPVNNQCVLLHGVNDTVCVQEELCRGLLKIKVRPYYLFHTDDVQATEHLRTPVATGVEIMAGLRGKLSGLGLPAYVVDLPGGGGKIPLQPEYLVSCSDAEYVFKNPGGKICRYRNPNPDY
jgi:lysine 2,3-aminomutase